MALPPEFHELAKKVNNWGRWGPDDERGTLNLITADVVRRGLACARAGKRFSLAIPLSEDGPQIGAIPGRTNP
ncbi:MAG: cyclase family protein, partial [Actinomycetota bacterium]